MSKTNNSNQVLLDFYRPHDPVIERGEHLDPLTGELVRPPSMTKQEFAAEADINNIVKHFMPHEMAKLTMANMLSGAYLDLPDSIDYQEAIHQVRAAEEAFMTLPSKVRDRFGQDPEVFLAFVHDPANAEELVTLGLREPPKPASSPAASVPPDAPPGPTAAPGSVTGGSGGPSGGPAAPIPQKAP